MEVSLTTSIALATIVFFLYKLLTRPTSSKNRLPEPWRLPIIGHMHHLIGTMPHRGVMDLARKYGSLMHLQLGEVSAIVVSSPKWAKEILTTYDIPFANRETGGFDVADIFPSKKFLHHLSGKRGRLTSIHNKLDSLINNLVAEHTVSKSSKVNETLLDVLLRLKNSEEFPLTADNVKAIILDMFGAGTDTSSATVEWAISELIRCPRAMEKVQAELRQALNGKERIKEEEIQDLPYLNLVIRETLRLHPPLPLVMPRECRQAMNLAGYDVANKTKLIVNVFAINRDPEYWKDAESFNPERFENSNTTIMGADYEYLPFGAGRRMCPGSALGLANVQLPLANILYYFKWKLPNGASHDQLDMTESFGATVQRKTELMLVPSF
ncbi:Germacrene A hydroxylase [Helianthus annuus]|nr:Germacrene A hydroxylase [Helianthus annuus]